MKRRWAVVAVTFAGCASGSNPLGQPDAATVDGARPDAHEEVFVDAPSADAPPVIDARSLDAPPPPPDAAPDAPPPPPDACVATVHEMLVNPVFDSQPLGVGWTETRLDPTLPLITDEGIEDSAPYAAYLGGISGDAFEPDRPSITDVLVQTITFPADATAITLTGKFYVFTEETTGGIYDTASVGLVEINDTPIETALAVNDNGATTGYLPFTYAFTSNLAGRTVKLRLTSSHDATDVSAFLFDTLSLKATYCP